MSDASTGLLPQFGRADGEQAGAAAQIQHIAIGAAAGEVAEHRQAQRRGLMMAGAEGQARLDPHRDHAMRHLAGIMRAIDEEAPGAHRRQAFLGQA